MLTGLQNDGSNRHWATRAKSTVRLKTLKRHGEGDELVEIQLSTQTRRKDPGLPEQWIARAFRYKRKGFRTSTVLTSLTDFKAYPRDEVVAPYHEQHSVDDPASDHGLILQGTSKDGIDLSSQENANPALRPLLTITYLQGG